ncbi:MAG: hypothetical protein ACI90V_010320 [Bacillariaceae sp.]|jgi:hypothetical protein
MANEKEEEDVLVVVIILVFVVLTTMEISVKDTEDTIQRKPKKLCPYGKKLSRNIINQRKGLKLLSDPLPFTVSLLDYY